MWIDDLTVALVSHDIDGFERILKDQPTNASKEEIFTAMNLINEAKKICQAKMDAINAEFNKIKLAKKYSQDLI